MRPRRADWLFAVAVIAAFVVTLWALFGALLMKALGW